MINNVFLIRIIAVILLITLLLSLGCTKDDNKLGSVNRVTKLSYFENDEIKWIYEYGYKNEKMVATDATIYIDGAPYKSKWEITYPSQDSIISLFTTSGNFPNSREILELQDGLTIRQSEADLVDPGVWKTDLLYEYTYISGQLTEEREYHGGEGSIPDLYIIYKKSTYEYEGNKLIRSLYYSMNGESILSGEDSISYIGDKLDVRIYYTINDVVKTESKKYIYFYEDNLLTQMDYYEKDYLGNWTLEENHFFAYNEFGNLVSRSIQLAPGAVVKYVCEYEGGKGNYRHFIFPHDDFWNPLILPIPD
jgi:hypothetical protein